MNTQLYTEMWDRFPGKSSQRMLMLAIARASDEKGTCRFTTEELATSARMSRTNVWRLAGELEKRGWIEVEHPQTKSGSMKVHLRLAKLEDPGQMLQPYDQRSTPRACRRSVAIGSQQGGLIFPPAVVEPLLRSEAFERVLLARSRRSALQQSQQRAGSSREDARPFGPFGKRRRW